MVDAVEKGRHPAGIGAIVVVEDVPVVVGHGGEHLVVVLLIGEVDDDLPVVLQGVLLGVGLLEPAEHGARVHLVAVGHGDGVVHGCGVVGALGENGPGGVLRPVAVVGQVKAVIPLPLDKGKVELRAGNPKPAVDIRVCRLEGGKVDGADVGLPGGFRLGALRLLRWLGGGFRRGAGAGGWIHHCGLWLVGEQKHPAHHAG